MDQENTRKSLNLHQDMIEEIMSALPVKSLLRFRCVSKSWRCLIGSDRFIKTQLEKSIKDPSYAHWRVVYRYSHKNRERWPGLTQCSVRSFLDEAEPDIHLRPFDDSTNTHLTSDCFIVGHCNGLLCILKKPGCLFLWNPTIRISIELPKLDVQDFYFYIEKYGFGMDEKSGAYKVFVVLPKDDDVYGVIVNENVNVNAIVNVNSDSDNDVDVDVDSDSDDYIGKLYNSKTNSWKTIERGCSTGLYQAGVLVGGKLHWLTKKGDYIESFDLSSEVFEMIEPPYGKGEGECADLREVRGMLCLTLSYYSGEERDGYDEWIRVLKHEKDGAKEHWVKVETKDNVNYYGKTFYVESLVSPVPLKNQ